MKDVIRKALLFGMGIFQISREKVEEFVDEIKADSDLTPEEGKKLVEEVMQKFNRQREQFTTEVEEIVRRVVKEMQDEKQ